MEYLMKTDRLPYLKIIGRMKYLRGWHRSTRCRFNVLFYMYSGEFVFELASGETLILSGGCSLFVPAGTEYHVKCTRDCDYSYLHFVTGEPIARKDECPSVDGESLVLPRLLDLSSDAENRDALIRRIGRLERAFPSDSFSSPLRDRCELLIVIDTIATAYMGGRRDMLPNSLRLMKEHVTSHIRENVSLSDLCEISGLSKQYVMRLFRKHLGMTATDYIHRTKLSYSLDLLKNTDMTVEEIAYQLGYCGGYYYCRLFKKYLNITPTEYRNGSDDGVEL
jgi:AraC-like DNA-binding protein